jgi:uncharacterized membrane protein YeaQ/YmgE (transglycosylase-associated protein family)
MSQSALSLWVPSIAGGLVGLFVGDIVSEVRPNSRAWGVVSKVTGLVVGATVGTLLSPNTAAPTYAASISTF